MGANISPDGLTFCAGTAVYDLLRHWCRKISRQTTFQKKVKMSRESQSGRRFGQVFCDKATNPPRLAARSSESEARISPPGGLRVRVTKISGSSRIKRAHTNDQLYGWLDPARHIGGVDGTDGCCCCCCSWTFRWAFTGMSRGLWQMTGVGVKVLRSLCR